jgi:hypothetical protein
LSAASFSRSASRSAGDAEVPDFVCACGIADLLGGEHHEVTGFALHRLQP